jgi:hypothetical protein
MREDVWELKAAASVILLLALGASAAAYTNTRDK